MGLNKGAPVQMRGVTIGKVHSFEMERDGENVVVTLEIEGQWLIPEGSRAQVVTLGLMDPKTVEVLPGSGPGTIGGGASLPGRTVKGILDDTESLGEMGQIVLDRITQLLSDKNLDAISGSAEGLNKLVAELSDIADIVESESGGVRELIASLNSAGRRACGGDRAGAAGEPDKHSGQCGHPHGAPQHYIGEHRGGCHILRNDPDTH